MKKLKKTLQEKLAELKNQLAELKKQVEQEVDYVRLRATKGERYYFLDSKGFIIWSVETFDGNYNFRYNTGNYFLTKKEAENCRKRLLIEQRIKDIALLLNDGRKIDWGKKGEANDFQKHFNYFNTFCQCFEMGRTGIVNAKNIYCLSDKFLDVVLEDIGEKDLKFYFGVEK